MNFERYQECKLCGVMVEDGHSCARTNIESYRKVLDLMAETAKLRAEVAALPQKLESATAEIERLKAQNEYDLGNQVAATSKERKRAEESNLQVEAFRTALGRISTIASEHKCEEVDALKEIARDALCTEKPKCICPHHSFKPDMKGCLCCGQTVGQLWNDGT